MNKKPKILSMNIEIRTVEGAKTVINKLQAWINEQSNIVNKLKINDGTSYAALLLDGINEDTENNDSVVKKYSNDSDVSNHANELL